MTIKAEPDLKKLFQARFDTKYSGFTGYPNSTQDTKDVIAACLTTWLEEMECISPPSANPKPVPVVSSAPSAFVGQLILAIGGAITFHTEMAAGYTSLVGAILTPPGGDYLGVGVNPITVITPLDPVPENADFLSAIAGLMTQNNTGEEFCSTLASAFSTAMMQSGLTDCVYAVLVPPGTPPSAGPLQFG